MAQLRELAFKLRSEALDAGEALGDIASRFGQRAANQGSSLQTQHPLAPVLAPFAALNIALFERAITNLVRDALKFRRPGDSVVLTALRDGDCVKGSVSHPGSGINAVDRPPLFDRFYQSRQNVAPATGEGGNGLAPAIVKRMPNFTAVRSPSPVRRAAAPV